VEIRFAGLCACPTMTEHVDGGLRLLEAQQRELDAKAIRSPAESSAPKGYRHATLPDETNWLRHSGQGTIISVRTSSSWQPCSSSSRSPQPRETPPYRTSPAPRNHCVSSATTALLRSNYRSPSAVVPPAYACVRSGLSPSAFSSLASVANLSSAGPSAFAVGATAIAAMRG